MRLSHRPSSHISKKGFLDSKIHLFRNTVIALLSAASLSFAQDKPQDTDQTHAQHGGIAQAINFMHSDDPSEEALDHLIPNDHHIHTILEAHYLHNHATSDGNLELIKEGIGLWIHTRIPISHSAESSTALKFWVHSISSTNPSENENQQADSVAANLLQNELNIDAGFIHTFNKRWKLSAGLNYIRENSITSSTHTSTETHLDDHGHPHTTTHTETSTHEHEYEWLGAYIDLARKFELSGIFRDRVSVILHLEHDESRTWRGNFASLTLQANRLNLTKHIHGDLALAVITGRGERYATSVSSEHSTTTDGRNVCFMPSFALHWVLNKNITLFASGVFIIPPQSKEGFAGSAGVSYTF